MLLSDEEIEGLMRGRSTLDFGKAVQATILAKLASAELPEPEYWIDYGHAGWAEMDKETFEKSLEEERAIKFTADQLRQAYAQGAASQLAEKPSAWKWTANKFHVRLEDYCPPDDAYDKDTLIELYTRKEASK